MLEFKIVKDINELNNLTNWEIPLNSKKENKLFNEKGQEVQSTFEGRHYRLYKRGHKPSGLEKFGLSLLVIFTLGIALASKYVYKSLFKGRVTKNFAICVNPASPQPTKQAKEKPQVSKGSPQKTALSVAQEPIKIPTQKEIPLASTQQTPQSPREPISAAQKTDLPAEKTNQTQQTANVQQTDPAATEDKRQIGVETFSYFVGGRENFEKLPQLDFNTLGTTKVHIGRNEYIDRPAWAPGDYPDSISVTALENIDSDLIRGVNGLKNYEYLIIKHRDYAGRSGIFVLFCQNEDGQFGGCKIHNSGGGLELDTLLYNMTCEVEDQTNPGNTRALNSKEKFRELFTKGTITGTNPNFKNQISLSLRSMRYK